MIAKLGRDLYIAKKELEKDPKNMLKKERIQQLEIDLEKATRSSSKDQKTLTKNQSEVPHIRVSETNGNTRSATGFSHISGGRTRARR